METVIKKEVIFDIFREFPQLNRMWVRGDLETFAYSRFVVEDSVHDGELTKFIYCHFDFGDLEFGPIVFNESFMRKSGSLDNTYTECKREDYV